ncbi:MAG: hypothetical protein U0822_10010 [Anaerolineae bacterium]
MEEFARALLSGRDDKLTCEQCGARLMDYIELQIEGAADAAYDDVASHIQVCPYCAREYRELRRLLEISYSPDLGDIQALYHAETSQPPDLRFLTESRRPSLPKKGKRILVFPTVSVEEHGRCLRARGGRVLAVHTLPSASAKRGRKVKRGPALDSTRLQKVSSIGRTDDWGLTVVVGSNKDAPETCTLYVTVERAGRETLEGFALVLDIRGEKRQAVTDAQGQAAFEAVPMASLDEAELTVQAPD